MQLGNYIGIPILALAAILNSALMPEFRLASGAPDLVFLLVVSWGLLADVRGAMFWAVVGGVFQDWLSIAPLGTSALGMVIVVFAADSVFGDVSRRNVLIPPVVALVGTVVYHLAVLLVLRLTGTAVPIGRGLFYVTLPTMLYNTFLVLPVYRVMGVVHYWLQPRRVRLE